MYIIIYSRNSEHFLAVERYNLRIDTKYFWKRNHSRTFNSKSRLRIFPQESYLTFLWIYYIILNSTKSVFLDFIRIILFSNIKIWKMQIPFDFWNAKKTEPLPNTPFNHPEANPAQIDLSQLINQNCNKVFY